MDRINRALDHQKARMDDLILKQQRPGLDLAVFDPVIGAEHKEAFDSYVRSGADHGLRQLEEKALSVGSDPDGGYLVPDETADRERTSRPEDSNGEKQQQQSYAGAPDRHAGFAGEGWRCRRSRGSKFRSRKRRSQCAASLAGFH